MALYLQNTKHFCFTVLFSQITFYISVQPLFVSKRGVLRQESIIEGICSTQRIIERLVQEYKILLQVVHEVS